jgi:hypothetical protein
MIHDTLREGEGEMEYVKDGIYIQLSYVIVLETYSTALSLTSKSFGKIL